MRQQCSFRESDINFVQSVGNVRQCSCALSGESDVTNELHMEFVVNGDEMFTDVRGL